MTPFAKALALHREGQLAQAQALYTQILQTDARHADALHLLGVVFAQTGDPAAAVEMIGKSLAINPQNPPAHNNLGKALHELKQYQGALHSFDAAIAQRPEMADTHFNRGRVLCDLRQSQAALDSFDRAIAHQPGFAEAYNERGNLQDALGQNQAALDSYEQAIGQNPRFAGAYCNRGIVLCKLGRLQAALASIEQAIARQPGYPEAYNSRGNVLHKLGQSEAALDSIEQAIAQKPDYADAWFNHGNVLAAIGRCDAALQSYDKAIAIRPESADAHANRGKVLQELGQAEAALACYARAIALDPGCAIAHSNRGLVLHGQKHTQAALESFDQAIASDPGLVAAHNNRGIALRHLGQFEAALQSYERAIGLNPEFAEAYTNRGNLLQDLGQYDAALLSHRHAAALLAPDDVEANFSLSLCLLQSGDFEQGWQSYEWRLRHQDFRVTLGDGVRPRWTGAQDLRGKTILLHSEQGLGDALQFCRYAKMLATTGARVVLEVPMPLLLLLARVPGVAQTVLRGGALPLYDYYCPLLSLPLAFKTDLASIPAPGRYIPCAPEKLAQWQATLGAKTRPRVGVAWSGMALHKNDPRRSIPLADFVKLLPDGFQYISLQTEVRATDQETLRTRPDIQHFGDALQDFTDTAALCDLVDLVVSVDTSVAHLAGAMGKPVWILLPANPDWRWLLDRDDSPWYATARLYRRGRDGDDGAVFERVRGDLMRWFGEFD